MSYQAYVKKVYHGALRRSYGDRDEARAQIAKFYGTLSPIGAYAASEKDSYETVCIAGYEIRDTSCYNECFMSY